MNKAISVRKSMYNTMVEYFCPHLSDDYVDMSDLYVDLSFIYVDFSEKYHHTL